MDCVCELFGSDGWPFKRESDGVHAVIEMVTRLLLARNRGLEVVSSSRCCNRMVYGVRYMFCDRC